MTAVLGCIGLKFVRARRDSRNTKSMINPLTNITKHDYHLRSGRGEPLHSTTTILKPPAEPKSHPARPRAISEAPGVNRAHPLLSPQPGSR